VCTQPASKRVTAVEAIATKSAKVRAMVSYATRQYLITKLIFGNKRLAYMFKSLAHVQWIMDKWINVVVTVALDRWAVTLI